MQKRGKELLPLSDAKTEKGGGRSHPFFSALKRKVDLEKGEGVKFWAEENPLIV